MDQPKETGIVRTSSGIFIVLFVLLLCAPFINERLHLVEVKENIEKRKLAEKVPFSLSDSFAAKYDNYYKDHFGFRLFLVNAGSRVKVRWFGASPKPELVLMGKQDWLFYNDTAGAYTDCYTHAVLRSSDDLENMRKHFEELSDSCASWGAKYLRVFWPEKQTIYPELMPYAMKVQVRDTLSRADQLINKLSESGSRVQLIDVRKPLLREKNRQQLYLKLDSHWNAYGAFLAYREFFEKTHDELGIVPLGMNDYEVSWKTVYEGDLLSIMGLSDQSILCDRVPVFKLKDNARNFVELPEKLCPENTSMSRNNHVNNRLRVLMFCDSYSMALTQFFSMSVYEMIYYWGFYDQAAIKRIKPDVVIEATVERYI